MADRTQLEEIVFLGCIGEVVHLPQPSGRVFEVYRRSPGVRLVIISPEKKLLVTKEHRRETGGIDLRLPGGKVCDTIEGYNQLRSSGRSLLEAAKDAAVKEALEETGVIIKDPELLVRANAGTTVEWDLYYFLVKSYEVSQTGQALEYGEEITVKWMSQDELRHAIAQGEMQEWRSVGVLLGLVLPDL